MPGCKFSTVWVNSMISSLDGEVESCEQPSTIRIIKIVSNIKSNRFLSIPKKAVINIPDINRFKFFGVDFRKLNGLIIMGSQSVRSGSVEQ